MHDQPPRTFSRRLSLLASIGLVIILGAGLTWYKGHRTATAAVASQRRRPDVVVILTDDQFYNTLWSMPIVRSQLRPQGRAVREHVRLESALRPLAGEHPDRPVLAHDGRVRQRAVQLRLGGGLPRFRLRELHDGHVVPRRGLPDGHRRQVPQRLRRRVDAAGLGRVGDRRRVLGDDAVREQRQAHLPALDVRDDAAGRQGRRVHRAARRATGRCSCIWRPTRRTRTPRRSRSTPISRSTSDATGRGRTSTRPTCRTSPRSSAASRASARPVAGR